MANINTSVSIEITNKNNISDIYWVHDKWALKNALCFEHKNEKQNIYSLTLSERIYDMTKFKLKQEVSKSFEHLEEEGRGDLTGLIESKYKKSSKAKNRHKLKQTKK